MDMREKGDRQRDRAVVWIEERKEIESETGLWYGCKRERR